MSTLIPSPVTSEEKREALDRLLASTSFSRHEQLRRFLQHVCELEFAGRAGEIHEYQIGIDVFGKEAGYSTGEDTTVRTRAHALRRKLLEYYSTEASGAAVRIEMPKGSYVPVFVKSAGRAADGGAAEIRAVPAAVPEGKKSGGAWGRMGLAFAAGILACLAGVSVWKGTAGGGAKVDPILRAAWGPLQGPEANTLVFIASPAHLFVRRLPSDSAEIEESGRPLGHHELPDSSDLRKWYFGRYPDVPGTKPYLIPTHNSPLWGDASGALTVVGQLAGSGTHYEIVPERASSAFSLRDRNAVVFGRPEYSPTAEFLLAKKPITIVYSTEAKEYVVQAACGPGAGKQYSDSANEAGRPRDDDRYGLITVLSSGGGVSSGGGLSSGGGVPSGGIRTVLFSGLASAGTQAAAEYFSSPVHLRQLAAKFKAEGLDGFPRAYQVLLRSRAIAILPVQTEYVSHCIIER